MSETRKQIASAIAGATWRELAELSCDWADIFSGLENGSELAEVQGNLVAWAEEQVAEESQTND